MSATSPFVATGAGSLFDAGRPSLRVHAGGLAEVAEPGAEQESGTGHWALPPVDALAISLVVTTAAAGWILAAAVLTGPALAVADGLAWAAGTSRGS